MRCTGDEWTDRENELNNNECFTKWYNDKLLNCTVCSRNFPKLLNYFVSSTLSNFTSMYMYTMGFT